ncbi:DHA2 family efflux MFS transporter permease subunit [Demequina aurantiaca]|uniref:DHA2 family efflux MFS transporter permease subunit n=1 Tax=Demequina aurantiaca TaxID=676200 RepID=UPI003D351C37
MIDAQPIEPASPTGVALPPAHSKRNSTVINLLVVSTFVVILNETVMGVAIPHLMTDLQITAVAAQWLTTAFLLTMAVVIPITGFLLKRFPTRGIFITAMSLFSAGTLLAAVAPGFDVLLIARVIQASGTAIMMPLLITTVMQLEPAATRGRRMGSISIVIAVAPAIGPTISGLILSAFNWRYMFIFVLPVALFALWMGWRRMENVTEPTHAPLDVLSVVLSALGFGGIVFGLSQLGESIEGGVTATTVSAIAVGAVALALFVWRQLVLQRSDNALLDLRVFRTPTFSVSTAMFMIVMVSLFGSLILLPLFMQGVLGFTVLQSGLVILPGGIVMGVLAPFIGKLYDRVGPRPLVIPGAAIVATVLWTFTAVLTPGMPSWQLVAAHVTLSIGLALMFTPLFSASLGSLPPRLYAYGSATLTTLQQVAAAAGTALFIAIMSGVTMSQADSGADATQAQAAGIQAAFAVGGSLALIAIVLAFFVRPPADSPHDHDHKGAPSVTSEPSAA